MPLVPDSDPVAFELGELDVFASPAELRPALGQVTGEANERRLGVALLVATRWVLHHMGYRILILPDGTIPADPAALDVVVVDCRPSWRQATIAAAVRFYKSPEVPFGVAGGWDMATYVRMSIPDVDLLLLGQHERFGDRVTGPEVRDQLAQVVANVLPEEWTVYPAPPEVTSMPCVVIQTVSKSRASFCSELYRMTVTVLEARPAGITGYDSVELVAASLVPALTSIDGLGWDSTDQGPMIAPGGAEAYGAVLNLQTHVLTEG